MIGGEQSVTTAPETLARRSAIEAAAVAAFTARTPASAAADRRRRAVLPGGDTRNSSIAAPHPLTLVRGEGTEVVDADGHRYLDLTGCFTVLVLGHGHPEVVAALRRQAELGHAFSTPNPLIDEVAQTLVDRLPTIEAVRFTLSGTEATRLAAEVARRHTGRPLVVRMVGSYHTSQHSPGLDPGPGADVRTVEFNDPDALAALLDRDGPRVAAVFVEPVLGAGGMVPPRPGYLQAVRAACDASGSLLVADEVITLRLAPAGGQERFGFRADLTVGGKLLGAGLPLGFVGASHDVLAVASGDRTDRVRHSGTFVGNAMALAAASVVLRRFGAAEIGRVNALGEQLARSVTASASRHGVPLSISGVGSLWSLHGSEVPPTDAADVARGDARLVRVVHHGLLARGVHSTARGLLATSAAMDDEDIDRVALAVDQVVAEIAAQGWVEA